MHRFDALSDNLKGASVLMLATFGLALSSALIKLVGNNIPVLQILLVRQAVILLMLGPALQRNFSDVLSTQKIGLQLARVLFAIIALVGAFTAVINMPLADATAIAFAKSFFMTVFAVLLLKEKVGRYRWGAVAVGFIGVAIMLKPGASGFNVYSLYALAGAAATALVMVIIRILSRTESSNSILAFQAIGVGVVVAIPAFMQWVKPTAFEWFLLVGVGVVSFYAQKANIYSFKHGEASLLASLDYVRLLYATALGYVMFSQLPQLGTWIGAFIIILASIFTIYREARKKKVLATAPVTRGML